MGPATVKEKYDDDRLIIYVRPFDCVEAGVARPVLRCWEVELNDGNSAGGMYLFELPDGTMSGSRY